VAPSILEALHPANHGLAYQLSDILLHHMHINGMATAGRVRHVLGNLKLHWIAGTNWPIVGIRCVVHEEITNKVV